MRTIPLVLNIGTHIPEEIDLDDFLFSQIVPPENRIGVSGDVKSVPIREFDSASRYRNLKLEDILSDTDFNELETKKGDEKICLFIGLFDRNYEENSISARFYAEFFKQVVIECIKSPGLEVIVRIPYLPDETVSNDLYKSLEKIPNKIRIIDYSGKEFSNGSISQNKKYAITIDYLGRIKNKMVRDVGIFWQGNKKYGYFYDGIYCRYEISKLLTEFISSIDGRKLIITDCSQSKKWYDLVDKYLKSTFRDEDVVFVDIARLNSILEDLADKNSFENLILITEVIDSGKTINRLYETFENLFDKRRIHPFSIIVRTIGINHKTNKLCYFFSDRNICKGKKIKFLYYANSDDELLRNFYSNYYGDLNSKRNRLDASVFWSFCIKAGFVEESLQKIRKDRPPLYFIPNMEQIVKNNASFLCRELSNRIDSELGLSLDGLVIITIDTPPNRLLCEKLKSIYGTQTIFIPESHIYNGTLEENSLESFLHEEWLDSLVSFCEKKTILLFDDYVYSGYSLEVIQTFLNTTSVEFKLKLKIIGSIVLFDFGVENKEEVLNLPLKKLYNINLNLSTLKLLS